MDIDFLKLFKSGEGENEQEAADPAEPEAQEETEATEEVPDEESEGGKAQEVTDPAEGQKGEKQDAQERKANAARRRRAETAAAVDAARREERQRSSERERELIKALGLVDPYNSNRPVTTREEYDAYIQARDSKSLERELAQGKLSPATLDRMIERKIAEKEQKPDTDANTEELTRQYAMLREIEPDAPELETLGANPEFVAALEETGHLVRAYQRVQAQGAKARAAAQQRQRDTGKEHLTATDARNGGGVNVTAEMRRAYKMLFPKITDQEIRDWEKKVHKK